MNRVRSIALIAILLLAGCGTLDSSGQGFEPTRISSTTVRPTYPAPTSTPDPESPQTLATPITPVYPAPATSMPTPTLPHPYPAPATAIPSTESPNPSPMPTAPLQVQVFNNGNVRETPITGRFVDQINTGETVQLLEKTADGAWYKVTTIRGITGWVRTMLLIVNPDLVQQVPVAPNTPATPLSDRWQTVTWEGLGIPIPPNARWEPYLEVNPSTSDFPVLATGAVSYPTITGTVELPFGPMFMILQFSGSLDDWLNHEQSRNQFAIDQQTVRDTSIAGRPAKVYQPVVTGTCNMGAYIVALDRNRLLWIWTDCLGDEPYDSVIKGLRINEGSP